MSERTFRMRMQCSYQGNNNAVAVLSVERHAEGRWQPLELDLGTPGFEIFVYSLLTCQHLYFRANCAERGLLLDSADGSIEVGTDADWNIETLQVRISARLASGQAGQADIDFIVGRMQQCPVSRNLRALPGATTRVSLA